MGLERLETAAGLPPAVSRGANCFIAISREPQGCNYTATESRMVFQDAPAVAGLLEPSGALGFLIPTENAWGCLLLHGRQLK